MLLRDFSLAQINFEVSIQAGKKLNSKVYFYVVLRSILLILLLLLNDKLKDSGFFPCNKA